MPRPRFESGLTSSPAHDTLGGVVERRKRTRLSYNGCNARKTKASFRLTHPPASTNRFFRDKNGTCQHCGAADIPCEMDLRSHKRPFYRVSGDVFEYSIKLLRRFVPEAELPELTVDNIQALLRKLESAPAATVWESGSASAAAAAGTAAAASDSSGPALDNVEPALLPSAGPDPDPDPDPDPAGVRATATVPATTNQEELSCLLLDSMEKWRYIGADSSIRWNHAARMVCETSTARAGRRGGSRYEIASQPGSTPPTDSTHRASLHPQHRRAVGLLHLRYWASVIVLTRPFLLFTVAHTSNVISGAPVLSPWDYSASLTMDDTLQFDVFETLDLTSSRIGLMDTDMIMDASFSGSQFLHDNLDGAYQP
ncbi:hypothetical protein B0T26DRAFT_750709 [Lasiosphaeria miniovina]|uniref:Uncharacterized protein n=1 Tax=Lasiosphaeria miniovina TaxID=1954250 RepID=A0AA40E5Q2_9PEZI|nr:uncharacterized protein B0T26DRAFT_750709 [Lasiosphaeria miniovina]KAK0723438.1 hypothetical protein B0T26DRAFT_750709 [Lasiosphaeria miniovina]